MVQNKVHSFGSRLVTIYRQVVTHYDLIRRQESLQLKQPHHVSELTVYNTTHVCVATAYT